jgi:hypothetical protein
VTVAEQDLTHVEAPGDARPPAPHAPWGTHAAFLLLLFLLAPIRLLGLLPDFSTHILGDVMDAAEYPWNEFWTAHALLDLGTNPFRTDYMFYPLGINLVQHTYTFVDGLLYTLARPLVPLLVFHNALTWLSVFLNSAAAYALLWSLTGLSGLAFIGAVAFAHSPVLTSYYGPQCLIEPYLFVFFVVASIRVFATLHPGGAVGAGILLGLSVYTYPYYFVAGLFWLAILGLHRLSPQAERPRSPGLPPRSVAPSVILTGLTVASILALVLMPKDWWTSVGLGRYLRTDYVLVMALLVYLVVKMASWLARSRSARGAAGAELARSAGSPPAAPLSGKTGGQGPDESSVRRPGGATVSGALHRIPLDRQAALRVLLTALLVAVSGLVVAFPYSLSYLTDVAVRSAVASPPSEFVDQSVDVVSFFAPFHPWLSPLYLRVAEDWGRGQPIVGTPAFLGWFWLCLLALAFALWPRRPELGVWIGAWTVFLLLCLGPRLKIHGIIHRGFVLPGDVLPSLPVLQSVRTLSRFLVPLVLFTIVIGCLLLKDRLAAATLRRRVVWYASALLFVALEYALVPYPVQASRANYQVPNVYHALAETARGKVGVLLDLPLFTHSGRRSEGRGETRWHYYQTVHRQKLIGGVSSVLPDEVFAFFAAIPGVRAFWSQSAIDAGQLEASLAALQVDWIVLNKGRYEPATLRAYLVTLRERPYLMPFFEDVGYVAFRVDQSKICENCRFKERLEAERRKEPATVSRADSAGTDTGFAAVHPAGSRHPPAPDQPETSSAGG